MEGDEEGSACPMDALSFEALAQIFSHLVHLEDLRNISLVCRRWSGVVRSYFLWDMLYEQHFGGSERRCFLSFTTQDDELDASKERQRTDDARLKYAHTYKAWKKLDNASSRWIWCAKEGHWAIMSDMLARGEAKVDDLVLDEEFESKGEQTALHLAVRAGQEKVARKLVEAGADPHFALKSGAKVLHISAFSGDLPILRWLVDEVGAEVNDNTFDERSVTPLMLAARTGQKEALLFLIERGADPCFVTTGHWCALMDAAVGGHVEMVELLLLYGCDVNHRLDDGYGPLHIACEDDSHLAVVKLLIEHGANVNMRSAVGITPLIVAADHSAVEVVRVLLRAGADKTVAVQGFTARDYAKRLDVVALLE